MDLNGIMQKLKGLFNKGKTTLVNNEETIKEKTTAAASKIVDSTVKDPQKAEKIKGAVQTGTEKVFEKLDDNKTEPAAPGEAPAAGTETPGATPGEAMQDGTPGDSPADPFAPGESQEPRP